MSKGSRALWADAAEQSPALRDFLCGLFHEDTRAIYGSDEAALDEGIEERPVEQLKTLLVEWRGWMDRIGWKDGEVVRALQDGLGVNRVFRDGEAARNFMNNIYDRMIVAVRERTGSRWKP